MAGRNHRAASAPTRSAAPLITRVMLERAADPGGRTSPSTENRSSLDAAIPPVSLLIRQNGLEQMMTAEIRPQRVGDPDFRVGNLPQEEIAHTHLAARSYQEVRVGLARRVEKFGKLRLVQL